MPSEAKTPLGLSQWVGTDRPKREDFNNDNQKIDLTCRSVLTSLSEHLEGGLHPTALSQQQWTAAATHAGEGIATSEGMHGLRYFQGTLEANVGGVWTPCGSGAQRDYKVYGVRIDTTNPDTQAAVTYTDDAVGMTPNDPLWDSTFLGALRPCVVSNGRLAYYLQKDNYRLRSDGAPADILSGEEGDVMIEVPKMAYAIYSEGDYLHVKVTDYPDAPHLDNRFYYNAHTRLEQGDRDNLYVGAYLGATVGGRLRSLSGKVGQTSKSMLEFRDLARTNGAGYDLLGFYPYMLLQCLYLIRFKNRNAQASVGMGYVSQSAGATTTGGTDGKGFFFGETTGKLQMKLFGMEDFWGNLNYFLDGFRTDASLHIWTATASFEDTAAWRDLGAFSAVPLGFTQHVEGNNDVGFLPRTTGNFPQEYYCDWSQLRAGVICYTGGHFSSAAAGGAFCLLGANETGTDVRIGARLMYL